MKKKTVNKQIKQTEREDKNKVICILIQNIF